jgi:hypothetical protein
MDSPSLMNYKGLLNLIDEFKTQFQVLALGNAFAYKYLTEEFRAPKNNVFFRYKEALNYKECVMTLSGNDITGMVNKIALDTKVDFYNTNLHLNKRIMRSLADRLLSVVFELVSTYSKHNNGIMLKELIKLNGSK